MKVAYQTLFIRQFKKLDPALQDEVLEKIKIFQKNHLDSVLKTHKLKGRLKNFHSFSVNYSYRIVFEIIKQEAVFLEIGDHEIYK